MSDMVAEAVARIESAIAEAAATPRPDYGNATVSISDLRRILTALDRGASVAHATKEPSHGRPR